MNHLIMPLWIFACRQFIAGICYQIGWLCFAVWASSGGHVGLMCVAWADDTGWENTSPLPNGFASAHNRAGTPCTERGELCGYLPSSLLPSFLFLDTVLCVECTLHWPQPDCHIHLQRRGITQRGKTVITGGREISVAYCVELYSCVEVVFISIVLMLRD